MSTQLRSLSDPHLFAIYQYVTGLENMTHAELSKPILRPGLQDTYYLFIIQYALLSLFGIVTNIWIVFYIFKNKLYHENTHAFFVNLCICHFVQSAFVLPITLLIIIVHNWILGQFMCYFVPMLQDIPLHAALLTHILIAWDRMRWLNDPMNSRFPSFVCCCATWLTGMVIALPYPIYTTYLDLGMYIPRFRDVGMCVVNLVDDSQEYMRGLFLLMYIAPSIVLGYLYIHTSKDLHRPDGELSVMMYEQRADIVANRQQRHSTASSTRSTQSPHNFTRSYDLYDAEADASREQRTQLLLGTMAACEIICIGPLMVLRFARQQIDETYENSSQFDLTYLMFVWIAFLPTVISPVIYSCWILSGSLKDRIWHYFLLSSRQSDSHNKLEAQRSTENSITQENTTETLDIESKTPLTHKTSCGGKVLVKPAPSIYSATNALKPNKVVTRSVDLNRSGVCRSSRKGMPNRTERIQSTTDEVNNSCSNITSSTYCNGNGVSTSSGIGVDFESPAYNIEQKSTNYDRESVLSGISGDRHSHRSHDAMFEARNSSLRRESSSTYERDMDIIDLLERERSMDLKEIIERERKVERIPKKQQSERVRTNSSGDRRKLPDISKIAPPNSPKRTHSTDPSLNFPNFVFTHQYNEFAEARHNRNRDSVDETRRSIPGKRNSVTLDEIDGLVDASNRISRVRSTDSNKSSSKSIRGPRIHADNLSNLQ